MGSGYYRWGLSLRTDPAPFRGGGLGAPMRNFLDVIVTFLAEALGREPHADGRFHWPWHHPVQSHPLVRAAEQVVCGHQTNQAPAGAPAEYRAKSRKRVCPLSGQSIET